MIETFAKVRWNITFIEEETQKVVGSAEIKQEILNICYSISSILGKIGEIEDEKIISDIKEALNEFDNIIKKIEGDDKNSILYSLLICHSSDIRFLFLSKEEQERILEAMKEFENNY